MQKKECNPAKFACKKLRNLDKVAPKCKGRARLDEKLVLAEL